MDSSLTRKIKILHLIIEKHIATTTPVSSKEIAEDRRLSVSPATVRNEMAWLESCGFIARSHAFSGAVPLPKGYRNFVNQLPKNLHLGDRGKHIKDTISSVDESRFDWFETGAQVLANVLKTLAFVTPPVAKDARLKLIEVVKLQHMQLLLLAVLSDSKVYKTLMTLGKSHTDTEIERAKNRFNQSFSGMKISALVVLPALPKQEANFYKLLFSTTINTIKNYQSNYEWNLEGISFFFHQPEFRKNPATNVAGARIVDDATSLGRAICKDAQNDNNTHITIGYEHSETSYNDFSVIVRRYSLDNTASGFVGVVAPCRMPYQTAIPAVAITSNAMTEKLSRLYR